MPRAAIRAVDMNKLVHSYAGSGLILAVSRDREKVVGAGETIEAALQDARKNGHEDPIIMRAPARDAWQ